MNIPDIQFNVILISYLLEGVIGPKYANLTYHDFINDIRISTKLLSMMLHIKTYIAAKSATGLE